MSDGAEAPPVATLADCDPDTLRTRAIEAGVIDEDTSPAAVGVVVVTEPERSLLQGLLINAYDNLNGAGKGAQAARAKRLSERLAGLAGPDQ